MVLCLNIGPNKNTALLNPIQQELNHFSLPISGPTMKCCLSAVIL